MPQRAVITGANGAGKSHFARRLQAVRPDVPLISLDALKLTTNWQRRTDREVQAELATLIGQERWIIEGGPGLLPQILPRADVAIWLDPPKHLRARRLLCRPWRSFGRTRPDLPNGNRDWPWQQYRFALKSLRNHAWFEAQIRSALARHPDVQTYRCRREHDLRAALDAWAAPRLR